MARLSWPSVALNGRIELPPRMTGTSPAMTMKYGVGTPEVSSSVARCNRVIDRPREPAISSR